MQASEWIYRTYIKLPFGYQIIKLKDQFSHLADSHIKWGLYREHFKKGIFSNQLVYPKAYGIEVAKKQNTPKELR